MGNPFVPAAAMILLGAVAGCSDRQAASPPQRAPATARAAPPVASEEGQHVARRYTCQADTGVVLLDNGTARVSLPGGERHTLTSVADSEPQVYTGDSLYFTLQGKSAHLSQQDGARELACTAGD